MARPEKIKTALGQRLVDVRKALSYDERPVFAEVIGIPKETLGGYERGDRQPTPDFFAMYRERFHVNLNWLLTGAGAMFEKGNSGDNVSTEIMELLARVAEGVHKEAGIKLPPAKLTAEAADLFNQLKAEVADLTDKEQIEANLPRLKLTLKRRLEQAKLAPGLDKQEVS